MDIFEQRQMMTTMTHAFPTFSPKSGQTGSAQTENLNPACMWLQLAAAQGGEFYQSQLNEAAKQLTPDQITQSKALAAAWKPTVPGSHW